MEKRILLTFLLVLIILLVFTQAVKAQSLFDWLKNLLLTQTSHVITGGTGISSTVCNSYGDPFSCIGAGCWWYECWTGKGCFEGGYCNWGCDCDSSFSEYCPKLSEADCKYKSYSKCCYAYGNPNMCVATEECTCVSGSCKEVYCGIKLCNIGEKCCIIQQQGVPICYNPKYYVCGPSGPVLCSNIYKFTLTGIGTCNIIFEVNSNCEGREIKVKDSQGNVKFYGTTPISTSGVWSVSPGTYTYDVFIDGVKDGSSGQLVCSSGPTTTTTTPSTTTTTLPSCPYKCTYGQTCSIDLEGTCVPGYSCPSGYDCCCQLSTTTIYCSGAINLILDPDPAPPSTTIKAKVSGLSNCDGKTAYVKDGGCPGGSPKCSCTISGGICECNFNGGGSCSPLSQPTYYACIDKNGDGDFSDSGESDYEVLEMNCVTTTTSTTTKPTTSTTTKPTTSTTTKPTTSTTTSSTTIPPPPSCTFSLNSFSLSPNSVSTCPSTIVASIGYSSSNCGSQTVSIRKNSCSGTQVAVITTTDASTSGSSSFQVTSNNDAGTYYACYGAQQKSATLSVNCPSTTTTIPSTTTSLVTTTTKPTTTTVPPGVTTTILSTTTIPPATTTIPPAAIECKECFARSKCECVLRATCNNGMWIIQNKEGQPLESTITPSIPPAEVEFETKQAGKISIQAACFMESRTEVYGPYILEVKEPFLDCDKECEVGKPCECRVNGCKDGNIIIGTIKREKINKTSYVISFIPEAAGVIDVSVVCSDPTRYAETQIPVSGEIIRGFSADNFISTKTDSKFKLSLDFTNNVGENITIVFTTSDKEGKARNNMFVAVQGSGKASIVLYCEDFEYGTYIISWKAFKASDKKNPIAWSRSDEMVSIKC